ncbi:hypothetical protein EDC65_0234 [Stella humosa]|uniref:Uncharacterized protein n=1 Tax=Stella humosa TaxID=94 RepID=A0A3N1M5J2_9PROT|nr:hypothetical protein [Stella humosa]ROQ01062.1 hypothetical protein EDC65_0234 [Stella humosa]BBK31433.1 hypothetical protein STHU_20670 [Stella humosa]
MRHVSVNFIRPSEPGQGEAALRRTTCLVENARHMKHRRLAVGAVLDIVLIGDSAALSPAMLAAIDNGTCRIHDGNPAYDRLAARFPNLVKRFGGPYGLFSFAFLRWLLVEAMFPGEPVLCYDGDIIHNVPLADLGRACAGLTFTATSTCFAAISNPAWFRAWEYTVTRLDTVPGSFAAARDRARAEIPGFDPEYSPEEFVAKLLIENGHLPQDPLPADFPYWIVPQPHLLPRLYSFVRWPGGPDRVPGPIRYDRLDGVDRLNGKPVAFWHMQKPFLNQLGCLMIFRELTPQLHPGRVPPLTMYGRVVNEAWSRRIDPYHDEGGVPPLASPEMEALAQHMLVSEQQAWADGVSPASNPFAPDPIARYYFGRHDLGLLFNDTTWPVPGIWA